MYIPKSLQEENVHNNCVMGLMFWTNWGPDQQKSKTPVSHDFWKNFAKVSVSVGNFEPDASLARTVPKKRHWPRPAPTTSYPAGCESESEKWKVKVKSEKWSLFGPLFFLNFIYIIYHVYTFIAIWGKSAQQLSCGFNILDKLESCPHKNQIPYKDMDFLKKVSKVTDFT